MNVINASCDNGVKRAIPFIGIIADTPMIDCKHREMLITQVIAEMDDLVLAKIDVNSVKITREQILSIRKNNFFENRDLPISHEDFMQIVHSTTLIQVKELLFATLEHAALANVDDAELFGAIDQ